MAGMIDCHCHLTDPRCYADAESLLASGREAGVTRWVLGGTDPEEWTRQEELAARHPGQIITNFGLHPWWVEKMSREEIDCALADLESRLPRAHGLGETGLDFYDKRDPARFADQRYAFERQVELAVRLRKPLVLHVVKAFDEALEILRARAVDNGHFVVPVVLHRYSGSAEQARPFLDLGAFLSFTGAFMDHDRGKKSRNALAQTPFGQLLIETDGPDTPFESLPVVYFEAAKLKGMEWVAFASYIEENVDEVWSRAQ